MTAEATFATHHAGLEVITRSVAALSATERAELAALVSESATAYALQTPAVSLLANAAAAEPFVVTARDASGLAGSWTGFFEQSIDRPAWVFKAMFRSGPVLREGLSPAEAAALTRALIEAGEAHAVHSGAMRMTVTSEAVYGTALDPVMDTLGYERHGQWATYLIDLRRPLDNIWEGIDAKVRRSVRTSEKRGVTVEVSDAMDDLRAFQAILDDALKAGNMPVPLPIDYAERCKALIDAGSAYVLIARHEGEVVGGKLDITDGAMAVSYNTAAIRGPSRCGDLLAWQEIVIARERGHASLDLLGAELEAEGMGEGITSFKAKWGGDLLATPAYAKTLPVKGLRGVARSLAKLVRR